MTEEFELAEQTVTLVLDTVPRYEGVEMEVDLDVGVREYFAFLRLLDGMGASTGIDETERSLTEAASIFASHLRGWNFQRKGEPVPATTEGVLTLPPNVLGLVWSTWRQAVSAGAPPPLARRSKSGPSTAGSSTAASSRAQRRAKTPR